MWARDMEDSLVKLYNKLMSNYDKIPPGVSQPLVKAKSIDDVPILSFTLWSDSPRISGYELRRVALELCDELKKDQDVAEFHRHRRTAPAGQDHPRPGKAQGLQRLRLPDRWTPWGRPTFSCPRALFPRDNQRDPRGDGGFLKSTEMWAVSSWVSSTEGLSI